MRSIAAVNAVATSLVTKLVVTYNFVIIEISEVN